VHHGGGARHGENKRGAAMPQSFLETVDAECVMGRRMRR
jgi:hypothetical protein